MKMIVSTSASLKDCILAVNPAAFNSTKGGKLTVSFQWDAVSLSEATDCTVNAEIRESALATLSKQERETLASLSARVKAEEKRLATLASQSRPRISRVSVKGMTACKA